ncbi:MAG: hypothetical protein ACOC2H_04810 [Spirochaetota bacterium]
MILNECKSCSHHICVIRNSVLCGYNIDRVELPITRDDDEQMTISDCPKQRPLNRQTGEALQQLSR